MEKIKELSLEEIEKEFGEEYYRLLKMNFFDISELPNMYRD